MRKRSETSLSYYNTKGVSFIVGCNDRNSCAIGTGGPFPWGKARPGRDADHSPTSSAVVVNE
jgi:hypothetical protein